MTQYKRARAEPSPNNRGSMHAVCISYSGLLKCPRTMLCLYSVTFSSITMSLPCGLVSCEYQASWAEKRESFSACLFPIRLKAWQVGPQKQIRQSLIEVLGFHGFPYNSTKHNWVSNQKRWPLCANLGRTYSITHVCNKFHVQQTHNKVDCFFMSIWIRQDAVLWLERAHSAVCCTKSSAGLGGSNRQNVIKVASSRMSHPKNLLTMFVTFARPTELNHVHSLLAPVLDQPLVRRCLDALSGLMLLSSKNHWDWLCLYIVRGLILTGYPATSAQPMPLKHVVMFQETRFRRAATNDAPL